MDEREKEEMRAMLKALPKRCLITGLALCESYVVPDENGKNHALYLTKPAFDGYTPFHYDSENRQFTHRRFDLDDRRWKEWESYDLHQVLQHPRFAEIVKHFGISETDIQLARREDVDGGEE